MKDESVPGGPGGGSVPGGGSAGRGGRARWAPLAVLAALTALALWLRLRAIPGTWGTDALGYVERALGDGVAAGGADTRSQRVVFIDLLRAALALGGDRPAAASWPGIALSACVGPVLYAAARPKAGAWLALLPAALWAVLGLDIEEVVEVSADAATALSGALAALALSIAAGRDGRARLAVLVAGGVAVGAGFLVKETAAFAGVALVAGAFAISPGRRGISAAAAVAAGAIAVVGVGAIAGIVQSPQVVTHEMAVNAVPVAWDAPGFLRRVTIGVPAMLLTATGAFGLLHVVALPLIVRLMFGAARGRAFAVAALAGLLAFDLAPVSLSTWAVLPATFPRYLLPVLPIWFVALTETLAATPETKWERRVAIAAALAALAFVGSWPATWIVLGTALRAVLANLPDRELPRTVPDREFLGSAAESALLVAAAACALLTPLARTAPDPIWNAWPLLPRTGAIHADRAIGRRLAIAARTAPGVDPAAATRIRLLDDTLPPPSALAAGDIVLVRRGSKLGVAAAARADLHALGAELGETVVLTRGE